MMAAMALAASAASAQQGAVAGEWRSFAGDLGSTKYSALDQIDADNVGSLRVAWRRPLVDAAYLEVDPEVSFSSVSLAAPVIVDGIGYVPNGIGLVEAFDLGSGDTRWTQPPFGGADELRGTGTRGVAYWTDGNSTRILAQRGEYLYALDPDTGETFPDFGDGGRVDLTVGLGEGARYRWGGAPTVVRDVVVVGQSMSDTFETKEALRGDVPGLRCADRRAPLAVSHHPTSRRVRHRQLGRRRLGVLGTCPGLVVVQRGRGARLCLHASHLADQRHVRRASRG